MNDIPLFQGIGVGMFFFGPALIAALVLSRGQRGLDRVLAIPILMLAELTLVALAVGATGDLSGKRLCAVQVVVLLSFRSQWWRPDPDAEPMPTMPAWLAALALPPLALSAGRALLAPPMNWDSLAYHLPFVVNWLHGGALTQTLALPAYPAQVPYFPAGGELVWLWAMLPFHSDFAAGILNHVFLALSCVAIAGLARALGAAPPAAAAGAALFAFLPLHPATLLGTANVDLYFTFAFLCAAHFALRGHVPLAAAAAGLALGTKLTALAALPVVALVAFAAHGAGSPRTWMRTAGIALALGGFWYARNAALTGNPLYPFPHGPVEFAERFADRTGAGRELAEAAWNMLGMAGPLLIAGWLAHAACTVRGVQGRGLHAAWLAGAAGLALLWFVLPGTALYVGYNLRYALPALAMLAVSCAVALDAHLPDRAAAVAIAAAALQLPALGPHLQMPAKWTLLALAALAIAFLVWLRADRRPLLVALLLASCLALFPFHAEHNRDRTRIDWFLASYHGGMMKDAAVFADNVHGGEIALAGPMPPYFFYGRRLRNRVHLVSPAPASARWLACTRISRDAPFPPEEAAARRPPVFSGEFLRVYDMKERSP
jgi:hypothetical protein